ncbi:MAG: multifunctional 2',3'-cyclic-nucleotide 2'-phosphodiesterase/5'-nucleotidase/3'-nucleotidase, partial [Chloroflexi bacterium]|nr:multifunctional 2',3'-cyclic-nucleotide 2'-phosphodiesterase/5'-nucleotidase/3'-nucleotidase [Chloroflexota bacterium]
MRTAGQIVVEGMNRLAYDAMTLGQLEFGLSGEQLQARLSEAQFPVLSANIVAKDGDRPFVQPYVIKELAGGHRAAIIGLTEALANETVRANTDDAFQVADPLEAARNAVQALT